LVGELELADGVGFEGGGAVVGEDEGRGEGNWGVEDWAGGVVGEVEIAGEADARCELGAEVDLGGGEVEGGGLGVSGEEDGAGADGPVGLGEGIVSWFGRRGEAESDVAGGVGGEGFGADGGWGAVAGGFSEGIGNELIAADL
jgi:hypothetical protein